MIETSELVRFLGGESILGGEAGSLLEFSETVERGLPVGVLKYLRERRLLSDQEIHEYVVSRRSLARREHERRLSPEESDRLARLSRIMVMAQDVFQDAQNAFAWLRRPNRAIGKRKPLELAKTDSGAQLVERLLTRIQHGVYS